MSKKLIVVCFLILLTVPVFGRINLIDGSLQPPKFIQGRPACIDKETNRLILCSIPTPLFDSPIDWLWWDSDWDYRKKISLITMDFISSSSRVILVDFNLTQSNFWDNVATDGNDVRFVSFDGENELELAKPPEFDFKNKEALFWVTLNKPDLKDGFYIYYGDKKRKAKK